MDSHKDTHPMKRKLWNSLKAQLHRFSNDVSQIHSVGPEEVPRPVASSSASGDAEHRITHVPRSFEVGDKKDRRILSRAAKVPDLLPCRLVVELDKKPFECRHYFDLRWQQDGQVRECETIARKFIRKRLSNGKRFYDVSKRYSIIEQVPPKKTRSRSSAPDAVAPAGACGLSSTPFANSALAQGYTERLRFAEDIIVPNAWQEYLPINVAKYLLKSLNAVYFLEIRFVYSSFTPHRIQSCTGECLVDVKETLYNNRVQTHKENVWFVPGRFLNKYFDSDSVKHMIRCDSNLKRYKPWTDAKQAQKNELQNFVSFIIDCGLRILATCIYAKLDLTYVYDLWKCEKQNVDLPIDIKDLPKRWKQSGEDFYNAQFKFRAHEFPDPGLPQGSEKVRSDIIIPFLVEEYIASGGYGDVFRVRIHESHHAFSPDRNQDLALKRFGTRDSRDDFDKEQRVCQQLARAPHEHLTPFLASWEHGGCFYMLFPYAKSNLNDFLMKKISPISKTEKLDWLLEQMRGLAKALDHVHNHLTPTEQQRRGIEHRKRIGCHHDLKPQNVLVFTDDNILKISDFGLTEVEDKRSRNPGDPYSEKKKPPNADLGYGAPEVVNGAPTSRSSDIWSLGCIYLDLLLWFFGHQDNIEAFRKQRVDPTEQVKSASYWRNIPNGNISNDKTVLKSVVVDRVAWLRERAQSKRVFRELVDLVELDMLVPDPEKRFSAPQVCSELKGLRLRAQLDKGDDDDFFDDPYAGPGKTHWGASTTGSPTVVSNDEYLHIVANGNLLHPGAARRNHSRQSSRSHSLRPSIDVGQGGAQFEGHAVQQQIGIELPPD